MQHLIITPSRHKLARLLLKVGISAPSNCADGAYLVKSQSGKMAGLTIRTSPLAGGLTYRATIFTGDDLTGFDADNNGEVV